MNQLVVVHTFNSGEAEAGRFLKFKASLVHRGSSRTARAIERNSILKNKKTSLMRHYFIPIKVIIIPRQNNK